MNFFVVGEGKNGGDPSGAVSGGKHVHCCFRALVRTPPGIFDCYEGLDTGSCRQQVPRQKTIPGRRFGKVCESVRQ